VLRRFRLHDAVQQLNAAPPGGTFDRARLAVDLGFVDQAHFSHGFKAITGRTPAEDAREAAAPADPRAPAGALPVPEAPTTSGRDR
jgi:transcriptional regulator GlxA family with amidase domain